MIRKFIGRNHYDGTLSGSEVRSILSTKAKASLYNADSTNSSICSAHDLIRSIHIVLPSAVATVRSDGVVRRYKGDFAVGVTVKSRITCAAGGKVALGIKGGIKV